MFQPSCGSQSVGLASLQASGIPSGIAELGLGVCPPETSLPPTLTTSFSASGVAQQAYSGNAAQSFPPCTVSGTLAGSDLPSIWGTSSSVRPRLHNIYGCLQPWMGAHMNDMELSGTWSPVEASMHINCLELKANYLCSSGLDT
jgi:hypothetical protein